MNVDCESFRKWAGTFPLVQSCEELAGGELRLSTPFLYPDGSRIDVFYLSEREFFESSYLSDLGQTSAYLADLHIYPHAHSRRALILKGICETMQVEDSDGELRVRLPLNPANNSLLASAVASAVFSLAHACARVADLSFAKKFKLPSGFNHQIGTYLSVATNIRYEVDVRIPGKYDKAVPINFRTAHQGAENLILTVSPQTVAGAHSASGEAFRKWHLLEPRKERYGFVTLLDDASVPLRDDDLQLLGEKSRVLNYPSQREELRGLLGD